MRRPAVPAESATLGFTHLQFEAMLTTARESADPCDFALVAMLGLLGLRIFEATGTDIADLGEEHGHRVLRVCGKGTKIVLVPLPPAVGRAIDRAVGDRTRGPVLLNSRGTRMDRHAATRRLRRLAETAGIRITRAHPHMLRHKVTIMLDAGVDLRDVQIAARHADPRTTMRMTEPPEPGPPPELHPRRLHGLRYLTELASPGPGPGRRPALPMSASVGKRAGIGVVPFWYHYAMAMNLRLDDEDSALLKALAEAEHVSLHEAALRAIRRSARELAHTDRVREATAEMLGRWGEVLDRLGHA